MKSISFRMGLFSALFLALTASAPAQSGDTATLYREAMAAYEAQDWVLASALFDAVYRKTKNPKAQFYLRSAQLKLAQGKTSETLEKQLSRVIIPNIEFEETDVVTALTFLRTKTEELSGGKVKPNFLYKRDPNNPVLPLVTLQVRNIPVTEVIRYIGDLTRTKFKYDAHAVLGVPGHLAPPEPAAP